MQPVHQINLLPAIENEFRNKERTPVWQNSSIRSRTVVAGVIERRVWRGAP